MVTQESIKKYIPDENADFCDPYNKKTIYGDKSTTLRTNSSNGNMWVNQSNLSVRADAIRGRYNGDGTTYQKLEIKDDGKSNTLTTVEKDNVLVDSEMRWRKLTPIEAERLQTVDDNYTAHVSNSRRYHMLGNGCSYHHL